MPSSQRQKDVCDLLDADHKAVKKMFKDFEALTESRARNAAQQRLDLAREICTELTVHAQVEEEIFYPALREAIKETDLLAEAEVEHQTAKDLIAQIQAAEIADEEFDARVKVLARGEVSKALTVQAHKFSGKAAEKIAAAGGRAEAI